MVAINFAVEVPKAQTPPVQHSRQQSTPAFGTQTSVDEKLLSSKGGLQLHTPKGLPHLASFKSEDSVDTDSITTTTYNRDSVFTNQSSHGKYLIHRLYKLVVKSKLAIIK